MKRLAYAGLDVHRDSITVTIMSDGGEILLEGRTFPNDRSKLIKFLKKYSKSYDLRCCYEASGCGYVVHRWLKEAGVFCEVIAPSLIPKRAGDRVKTDKRDSLKLAKYYRSGDLVTVHIPTEAEESVRDLVRCRGTFNKEVLRAKHYILKFLRKKGFVYRDGKNWTERHWRYLRKLELSGTDEMVYRRYLNLLEYNMFQLKELDVEIEKIAFSKEYKEKVSLLRTLRGIDTLTAMVLMSETIDFMRFDSPPSLMSYFGLTPGEYSSGDKRKQGGITKAGNTRCRHILIEAAWHYRYKPALGANLKKRQLGQPVEAVRHSWRAQQRLYKKFWSLCARKEKNKAVVAVARELTGFIWSIMTGNIDSKEQTA